MNYSPVLITHVVNDAVIEGFIPALINQTISSSKTDQVTDQVNDQIAEQLTKKTNEQSTKENNPLVLITDHKEAHMEALINKPLSSQISVLECDVFNPLAIIETLINHYINPTLIFSNSDHLQASTAIVADFFHLPTKDWRLCLTFKDKYLTRQQLVSKELHQPQFQLINPQNFDINDVTVSYPLIAKPKQGVASLKVQLCPDQQSLLSYSQEFCSHTPILVESFVEGRLITLETLGDGEKLVAVGGFEVTLTAPPYFVELEAIWNTPLCQKYREACLIILKDIGVGLGVCHSEFIVTDQGELHLVEINYRSIGDGREFLLNDMAHYPWFETITRLHQGITIKALEAEFGHLSINAHACIHYVTATHSGTVRQAAAPFEKRSQQGVAIHQPLMQLHQSIQLTHSNKDYLSRLLVYSSDAQNVDTLLEDTLASLDWQITA